jgi:hypothetical protein
MVVVQNITFASASETLTALLTISTIVIGGVLALVYGSNRVLRDTATDLRSRVSDLEAYRAEAKGTISALVSERDVLRNLVQGAQNWAHLEALLVEHHTEASHYWETTAKVMEKMTQTLQVLDVTMKSVETAVRTG